jgi:hypothetical protein
MSLTGLAGEDRITLVIGQRITLVRTGLRLVRNSYAGYVWSGTGMRAMTGQEQVERAMINRITLVTHGWFRS